MSDSLLSGATPAARIRAALTANWPAVTLVLLAGAIYAFRSLALHADTLGALVAPSEQRAPSVLRATLIIRENECATALEVLDLFDRPATSQTISLKRVYVIGGAATVARLSAARDVDLRGRKMEPLPAWAARHLESIGYADRPAILLFDASGSLTFAAGLPNGATEYVALGRWLFGLATRRTTSI